MASAERIRKVSEQIRRDLATILPKAIFHEKIAFVSVTGMNLSRDFKHATVYITVIGDDQELRGELMALLEAKASSIRHLLSQQMTTRTVPALDFKYDESIEYGAHMDSLLTDIAHDDEVKNKASTQAGQAAIGKKPISAD